MSAAEEYTPTTEQMRNHVASIGRLTGRNGDSDAAMFDRWLAKHDAEVAAAALRKAADEHERELVCCDIYDRMRRGEQYDATDHHHICYWGAACAEGDRRRADEIAPTTSKES